MKSVKIFSKQKLQVDECPSPKVPTWGSLCDSGSAWEITAPLSLTLFLVIAIHSIVTMVLYSVRAVTGTILNDRSTVSSCSTSIIQWLLKGLVTEPIFAYTICSTYRRKNENYLKQKPKIDQLVHTNLLPHTQKKKKKVQETKKIKGKRHHTLSPAISWPYMQRKSFFILNPYRME